LDRLIASIVAGSFEAGEMLPKEVDLTEKYDVSRGVARETVKALEERGLVWVKHGIGSFVNTPDKWNTAHPDVLKALINGHEHDAIVRESDVCWSWHVEKATELAAKRGSLRGITRMREAVASMEGLYAARTQVAGWGEAAEPFYAALFMATENRPFRGTAMGVLPLLSLMPSQLTDATYVRERVLPEYRKLVYAIESGDAVKAREQLRVVLQLEGRGQDHYPGPDFGSFRAAA
jgi:DNA-binding FadR family transcriptional regulator